MEPHENWKINLQKAISAHEEAEAAMADLIVNTPAAGFEAMLERIRSNLAELRLKSAQPSS
jgi:hypothetical protein